MATQLFNEESATTIVPELETYRDFFFYVPHKDTVTIFVYSMFHKMSIYANVHVISDNEKKGSWEYPRQEKYDFS